MEETVETTVVENTATPNYNDYIEQIKNLKNSTVSKDEYQSLVEERNTLLNSLVNGQQTSTEEPAPESPNIKELRNNLFRPDHELNDIEYVTRALALRSAIIEEEGKDCFVGASHSLTPTSEDYEKAEKTARILQECLDTCNGDNGQFIAALQSRMVDNFIPRRK